ncbi:MAG: hypothetical protein MJA28_06380 [Gammaproteobacteria bacterium]|nr:hypothetical protein [Gammaproteobacteria bacterium]
MSHTPEEILESLIVNMNGIIEDELMMGALKLEPPPAKTLTLDDLKKHAKTQVRQYEGRMVTDYFWREQRVITIYEPDIHSSGKGLVFAIKRWHDNGVMVTPKLFYRPPPPEPVEEESKIIH